jgi:hypothetical protein
MVSDARRSRVAYLARQADDALHAYEVAARTASPVPAVEAALKRYRDARAEWETALSEVKSDACA